MEQNSTSFLNSTFLHVEPYSSYYGGIRNVLTMWRLKSNPFTNDMAPLKLISEVAQIGIVTNYGEPPYEDDDSSKRKHNLKMT